MVSFPSSQYHHKPNLKCANYFFDIQKHWAYTFINFTGITGMNPKASFGNRFRSKLWGIKPSALRDCSTYQFRCASLSELEFHNQIRSKHARI
jgi:hypothetical protein